MLSNPAFHSSAPSRGSLAIVSAAFSRASSASSAPGAHRGELEPPGRDVGGGDAVERADLGHRDQPVGGARIEQGLLGQRAGRHHPDDGAVDHRFGAALPGLGRAFDLLGDGDAVPGADQPGEIGLGGVDGHAAHRDRRPLMLAARGQRDVEVGRGHPGVVEEQFEEVAHPVEQQAALGLGLQRQILRHHRGRFPACLRLGGHAPEPSHSGPATELLIHWGSALPADKAKLALCPRPSSSLSPPLSP